MKRGRKPHAVPKEMLRVYVDSELLLRIRLRFTDPLREKTRFGALSTLVESLLREWDQAQMPTKEQLDDPRSTTGSPPSGGDDSPPSV